VKDKGKGVPEKTQKHTCWAAKVWSERVVNFRNFLVHAQLSTLFAHAVHFTKQAVKCCNHKLLQFAS